MNKLTPDELNRYSRQCILGEVGTQGQERLKNAKVLIVGLGGLGSPLAMYLAGAGVGMIGLVDFDSIEVHNLQRQILYSTHDVGRDKVVVANERLQDLNPHVMCKIHNEKLSAENALHIIEQYDIVADGTDNFPTRYLVNDACVKLGKTNVFASIHQFEGQLSVFNLKDDNGEYGPNYRDLFPSPPKPNLIPNCEEAGILGPVAGILASMQALEILKIISGIGSNLSGYFLSIDLMSLEQRKLKFNRSDLNPVNANNKKDIELIDYDLFCGVSTGIPTISVQEMLVRLKSSNQWKIIDIRESHEFSKTNIGAEHFPLSEIMDNEDWYLQEKKLILICQSGKRTAMLLESIRDKEGSDRVVHLGGGINKIFEEMGEEFRF